MINGLSHKDFILEILKDGLPHFSREFVRSDDGGDLLLHYTKRISELRDLGHNIESIKIPTGSGKTRPGYILKETEESAEPWQRHPNVTSEERRSKLAKELSKRHPIVRQPETEGDLFRAA